jgi:hypothetical protein
VIGIEIKNLFSYQFEHLQLEKFAAFVFWPFAFVSMLEAKNSLFFKFSSLSGNCTFGHIKELCSFF